MPASKPFIDMLKSLRDTVQSAIRAGLEVKRRVYLPGAKACYDLYLGNYKQIFGNDKDKNSPNVATVDSTFLSINVDVNEKPIRIPVFTMADNVVATYAQVYAPYLGQGEMTRTVRSTQAYAPPPAAYGIDPEPMQQMQMQFPGYIDQQNQAMMQMQIDQMMMMKDNQIRDCRATMLKDLLNYFAKEMNHRAERKLVIDESLIVGGGMYMTELAVMPETDMKIVASNFLSMNDIIWDPDATRIKDCKWLAVQYRAPAWQVARQFGIPEADLKPNTSSTVSRGISDNIHARPEYKKDLGKDEVVYYKFWSRMGIGARLQSKQARNPMLSAIDEMCGDYTWVVVTDCCDYPLNFGPTVIEQAQQAEEQAALAQQFQAATGQMVPPMESSTDIVKAATAWPDPFFLDIDDPWPVTELSYFTRPGSPYPVPPLEFCLSYINFMAWVICFVADKCYRSMRTIWLIDEQISDQLKEAIRNGQDEAVVNMKGVGEEAVKQFVQFLEAPEMKGTIFDVYSFFQNKFERASGLSDLMQAKLDRATRSATEAKMIGDAATLRPQAMADQVYHVDTRVARKEALVAMLHLSPRDIGTIMGQPAAMAWQNLIMNRDITELMREAEYDVIASPGRVLDLNTRADQAANMAQMVLPLLVNIGQTYGLFGPANAILTEWAQANQIDPKLVQIPNMPPPQMIAAEAKGVPSPPKKTEKQEGE